MFKKLFRRKTFYTMQRLHGDYDVYVGQVVYRDTVIGTANGHGVGALLPSHDHIAFGENSTPTNAGWFNGSNKTLSPRLFIKFSKTNYYAHFVYNKLLNWGGYDYLQKTPFNWYTDYRGNNLHDGIDALAPKGSKLYAGINGVVTDVGKQKNGLTYCYIKLY